MNRYTSPELSRQLAEAGVEQKGEHWWYSFQRSSALKDLIHAKLTAGQIEYYGAVRALDLTDCLEALTREREGEAGLVERGEFSFGKTSWELWVRTPDNACEYAIDPVSPAEAAGRVLLAMLRERKEAK